MYWFQRWFDHILKNSEVPSRIFLDPCHPRVIHELLISLKKKEYFKVYFVFSILLEFDLRFMSTMSLGVVTHPYRLDIGE